MKKSNGKIWPYAIAISIALVFCASILTIVVAVKLPVEKSDAYMMGYQEADANANELIEARIAFDKKYQIEFIKEKFSLNDSTLQYKVIDTNGNLVSNAKIVIVITRPNVHEFDRELKEPTISNGIYEFSAIKLPKEGRWNVMAKINVDKEQRFFNVKLDTRKEKVIEY